MSTLFTFLTMPLGLPINPFYGWLIMVLLGCVAFYCAWFAVGKLGLRGEAGSLTHWVIRIGIYIALWAIARGVIWMIVNWQLSLMAVGGVAAAVILSIIAITIMRQVKKHRTVNGNA